MTEHFQMGTLKEIGAKAGDTVEVLGGPRWVLTKVDETGFYVDDKVAPKLSETLTFRLIRKGNAMTITDPSSQPKFGYWTHRKGGQYEIVGIGIQEHDHVPVVIYRSLEEPAVWWTRPCTEFFDGRFVRQS